MIGILKGFGFGRCLSCLQREHDETPAAMSATRTAPYTRRPGKHFRRYVTLERFENASSESIFVNHSSYLKESVIMSKFSQ